MRPHGVRLSCLRTSGMHNRQRALPRASVRMLHSGSTADAIAAFAQHCRRSRRPAVNVAADAREHIAASQCFEERRIDVHTDAPVVPCCDWYGSTPPLATGMGSVGSPLCLRRPTHSNVAGMLGRRGSAASARARLACRTRRCARLLVRHDRHRLPHAQ